MEADLSMQRGRCGHGLQMSENNAETVSGNLAVDVNVVDVNVGYSCQYCHRQS